MQGKRYAFIDGLRGFTVLSMVCYHACWDLVNLAGFNWTWYQSAGAYIWQQSICWVFIFLSGWCCNLGRRHFWRGLELLLWGTAITSLSLLLLPREAIIFGVLFFLGAATLILTGLNRWFKAVPGYAGLGLSVALFVLVRNINDGALGFEGWRLVSLPVSWYQYGYAGTFLGFKDAGFFSTDYFSLLPWFFLYLAGYFAGRLLEERPAGSGMAADGTLAAAFPAAGTDWLGLKFLGRHALVVYLLHQPVLLGLMLLFVPTV